MVVAYTREKVSIDYLAMRVSLKMFHQSLQRGHESRQVGAISPGSNAHYRERKRCCYLQACLVKAGSARLKASLA